MQLHEYMAREGLSDGEFAAKIGKTRMAVFRYRTGRRMPSADAMAAIARATAGAVTPNDFVLPAEGEAA
jgi:putative transcriptional regulator